MLISRFATIFLIPVAFVASICNALPISLFQSVVGAFSGYAILFGFSKFFFLATKKEGIGQGDLELLALIGAFTGFLGSWLTLFLGSCGGTMLMIPYMLITKKSYGQKIPFGPFLACGAMAFVLWQQKIVEFFLR